MVVLLQTEKEKKNKENLFQILSLTFINVYLWDSMQLALCVHSNFCCLFQKVEEEKKK